METPARVFLTAVTLLALAACDASDPGSTHPLVGSWTVAGFQSRYLVTTNADQRVVDRAQPGAGTLTVSGDETATPRYLAEAYRSHEYTFFNVASDAGSREGLPDYPSTVLSLNHSVGAWSVGLSVRDDDTSQRTYFAELPAAPLPFTYSAGVLTVPAAALTAEDGSGRVVTVEGTLTFVTQAVSAGVETPLIEDLESIGDLVVYTFEAGGIIRATITEDGETTTETGRWEDVGDGKVRISEAGATGPTFTYDIEGTSLRLSIEEEGDCTGECLRGIEGRYLLEAGSVSAARRQWGLLLERGAASRFAPAPAAARAPSTFPDRLPLLGLHGG